MPKTDNSKKRYIFLFLRIAVIAAGITWGSIWVSRDVGWNNLANTFLKINPAVLALALAIFLLSIIVISLRWWLLLRAQAIYIPFWAAVRLYFLGWFYNNFMPSSVGGDLIRAWYVTRHTDKKLEAVLSVFVDRAIGLASVLAIALFCYLLFLHGRTDVISFEGDGGFLKSVTACRRPVLWAFSIVLAVIAVLSLFKPSRNLLKKLWVGVSQTARKLFTKVKDSIGLYCKKPLAILVAFCLTVFIQLSTITGFWMVGTQLGVQAGIKYYYVFFTLVWVLGTVPISIGGAVVMEAALACLFIKVAGVESELAIAVALCQRMIWMLASLPGAVIHLIGAHLPKDFSVDYGKSVN